MEGAAVVDVAMVWRSEYACSMGMVGGVPIGTDLWLDSLQLRTIRVWGAHKVYYKVAKLGGIRVRVTLG